MVDFGAKGLCAAADFPGLCLFFFQLDITLDAIQLVDQFEWDISDPGNNPETFAEAFAAELGLSGEFV